MLPASGGGTNQLANIHFIFVVGWPSLDDTIFAHEEQSVFSSPALKVIKPDRTT